MGFIIKKIISRYLGQWNSHEYTFTKVELLDWYYANKVDANFNESDANFNPF